MHTCKSILSTCKRDLTDIYKHAIESVKPETLIKSSIQLGNESLVIKDPLNGYSTKEYDIRNSKIHVVGGGKCVLGMATALGDLVTQARLSQKFSFGSISVPYDLQSQFDVNQRSMLNAIDVKCSFGSAHNLPDENSVEATEHILDSILKASESDKRENLQSLFLVFISGGGSACLTSPKHMALNDKLQLINKLVQVGVDIVELNKVRRCFSNVKGGLMAQHILRCNPNSKIITLILSDVIGNPIEFIASGPTYIDEDYSAASHKQQMIDVLQKYGLQVPLINSVDQCSFFSRGLAEKSIHNIILGSNNIALEQASTRAKSLGYKVCQSDFPFDGVTSDAVEKLLSLSENYCLHPKDKVLFLAGGETTVKKLDGETWGIGGRAQEFCLDYMIYGLSAGNSESDCVDMLLAASTDGQDGPTDVAGCFASLAEYEMISDDKSNSLKFDINDCLQAKRTHNSYKFWSTCKPDWLIKTGLTGTNVMDLYAYLKIAKI